MLASRRIVVGLATSAMLFCSGTATAQVRAPSAACAAALSAAAGTQAIRPGCVIPQAGTVPVTALTEARAPLGGTSWLVPGLIGVSALAAAILALKSGHKGHGAFSRG